MTYRTKLRLSLLLLCLGLIQGYSYSMDDYSSREVFDEIRGKAIELTSAMKASFLDAKNYVVGKFEKFRIAPEIPDISIAVPPQASQEEIVEGLIVKPAQETGIWTSKKVAFVCALAILSGFLLSRYLKKDALHRWFDTLKGRWAQEKSHVMDNPEIEPQPEAQPV